MCSLFIPSMCLVLQRGARTRSFWSTRERGSSLAGPVFVCVRSCAMQLAYNFRSGSRSGNRPQPHTKTTSLSLCAATLLCVRGVKHIIHSIHNTRKQCCTAVLLFFGRRVSFFFAYTLCLSFMLRAYSRGFCCWDLCMRTMQANTTWLGDYV